MNLRDKYNHAIQTAKGFRMEGAAEERDGKLYFKGIVKKDEVNKIWDADQDRSRLAQRRRRRGDK